MPARMRATRALAQFMHEIEQRARVWLHDQQPR
jgi:hypothetical protein